MPNFTEIHTVFAEFTEISGPYTGPYSKVSDDC